eukprot:1156093-Pelagomonas_calceolata.AAC.6
MVKDVGASNPIELAEQSLLGVNAIVTGATSGNTQGLIVIDQSGPQAMFEVACSYARTTYMAALVLPASTRIGMAVVEALASKDAHVIFAIRNSKKIDCQHTHTHLKAERVAKEIRSRYEGTALVLLCIANAAQEAADFAGPAVPNANLTTPPSVPVIVSVLEAV